ncbi:hypothetical protein SCLCIDRAFT_32770 [Scleroderma citrinum Foug A]|uniref:Uncharacterized protein n=1 Tax=Scleroderma citrinum Foug A TaxID=1036808 RepID=A0A0C2ZHH0_9AGAM|nr:hypothetical protein SCLCIDRAFT_32770 [Scleroderma citrinum Foug A]
MDHLPFYAIFEKPVPLDLNLSFSSPTHHQHSSSSTRQQGLQTFWCAADDRIRITSAKVGVFDLLRSTKSDFGSSVFTPKSDDITATFCELGGWPIRHQENGIFPRAVYNLCAVNHRGARRDDDTDEVYIGHKDIAPCRTCNPMGKVEMEFKDSVFHGAAWFD